MAKKYTSFAYTPYGELVYSKTGSKVPLKRVAEVERRGNGIYSRTTGRKVGTIAQKKFQKTKHWSNW